jgi:hypothetical protein
MKIMAGLAGLALCLPMLVVKPGFSQAPPAKAAPPAAVPAPVPTSPPGQPAPSPAPLPPPATLPPPAPSSSPQLGAQPAPLAPGEPSNMSEQPTPSTQEQNTPATRNRVVSHRRREVRRPHRQVAAHDTGDSYVTPWSGPYVIERAQGDAAFVVEGRWFRALSPCPGWVPGERVSLRARLPGQCVLLNRTRHRTCPVSCESRAGWGPDL